jgi:GNAT superfamily N-acetyltransferase
MLEVRPCTVAEFFSAPSASALMGEYGCEASIHGMPEPIAHRPSYEAMESAGALDVLVATVDGDLVGFLVLLTVLNPHYSQVLSVTESYFVASDHRKSGAGLELLRAAEDLARSKGSVAMLVSAPIGGRLADVMPHVGYRETNRVFFRGLHV